MDVNIDEIARSQTIQGLIDYGKEFVFYSI